MSNLCPLRKDAILSRFLRFLPSLNALQRLGLERANDGRSTSADTGATKRQKVSNLARYVYVIPRANRAEFLHSIEFYVHGLGVL
jgi:hypothetical protein